MQQQILSHSLSRQDRPNEEGGVFRGRGLVVASGVYDILATTPLILPFSARAVFEQLKALHVRLDYGGANLPTFEPMHLFFVGLLASVVTVWSLLRIFWPSALLGRLDGITRLLFSAWMVWALLNGQSRVLLAYLIIEFAFGLAQLVLVRPNHEGIENLTTGA